MRRTVIVFLTTGALMWFVFATAQWYADNASLPRYCGDPESAIAHIRQILTSKEPVGDKSKRPFVIAAKLIFLVPRTDGESLERYLYRLRQRIAETCQKP